MTLLGLRSDTVLCFLGVLILFLFFFSFVLFSAGGSGKEGEESVGSGG